MVGLVVVAHGELGKMLMGGLDAMLQREKRSEAERLSIMKKVTFVSIGPDDDFDITLDDIGAAVHRVKSAVFGDCVLILTDMFGGTPSNKAMEIKEQYPSHQLDVVAGVNLPMLYKLALAPDGIKLDDLASLAEDSGRKAIRRILVSEVLHDRIIALEGVCAEECAGRHCACNSTQAARPDDEPQAPYHHAALAWAA